MGAENLINAAIECVKVQLYLRRNPINLWVQQNYALKSYLFINNMSVNLSRFMLLDMEM